MIHLPGVLAAASEVQDSLKGEPESLAKLDRIIATVNRRLGLEP